MRILATVGLGIAVILGASAARSHSLTPQALRGAWAPEGDGGCGADTRQMTFEVLSAVRQITPSRWYLNLLSPDGTISLDVNLISNARILLAERPLGEARYYVRCGGV